MTCNVQFEGVFCPSITITNADGTIDYDNWGKHLDHLIDAGIDGVLLFGSIGEFYAIDVKTKAEAVRFAVSKVAGRMKVLVGVGDTNLDNVRTLAAESEAAGADALVAVSPYYFGPSPDCAKRYFSAVAKATTLPVILYNFPASTPTKKLAVRIDVSQEGEKSSIDLTENDLVFITNGGCVENSTMGSQNSPAAWNPDLKPGGGWDMWRRIAEQDPSFGHPEKFCSDPNATKWMSATVTTLDDEIPPYIQKICKRDPFSGKVVTGGIVTVQDSNWLMSWTLNRQQQFRDQPKDQLCVWVYGLFPDKPGNYVKKPMTECTGEEICEEWLYHMGVPTDKIESLAKHHANTVPVMMPYITAFFMPRAAGDRPDVVPDGAVNFAFLGQFAETPRDTIFTTEYSMRTGMEAVYTLLGVDRGVPEVWGSVYDVRNLLNATVNLRDGAPVTDMKLNFIEKAVVKKVLKKLDGTDIATLLREYHVI